MWGGGVSGLIAPSSSGRKMLLYRHRGAAMGLAVNAGEDFTSDAVIRILAIHMLF